MKDQTQEVRPGKKIWTEEHSWEESNFNLVTMLNIEDLLYILSVAIGPFSMFGDNNNNR